MYKLENAARYGFNDIILSKGDVIKEDIYKQLPDEDKKLFVKVNAKNPKE